MTIVDKVKRSRPLQGVIVLALFIAAYFFVFSGSTSEDSYSPEELNSLIQNKGDEVNIKKIELLPQAITKPYLDTPSYKSRFWDLKGNTLVKNGDYIRLTSDIPRQTGSMFSKHPINAESFEMELTFHIHGKTSNGFVGDGMAIWFTETASEIGDVFGAQNYFNGLGVMIDTYRNGKRGHFPYVNIMNGNGQTYYNKDTDGYETRIAGCKAHELLNPKSGKTKARIVYIKDGYFSLDFDYTGDGLNWQNCVTLSDIQLPSTKYLGISAETGGLSENNDVIENRIFALYKQDGSAVESMQQFESLLGVQGERSSEDDFVDVDGEDPEEVENLIQAPQKGGGRHRRIPRKKLDPNQRRKSQARLRASEKRIKERERQLRLEKYGDAEATFFSELFRKLVKVTKYFIYCFLGILVLWVARILYRVQRQRGKPRTTGLLD